MITRDEAARELHEYETRKRWSIDTPIGRRLADHIRCPQCGEMPVNAGSLQGYGLEFHGDERTIEPITLIDQRMSGMDHDIECSECGHLYYIDELVGVIDSAVEKVALPAVAEAIETWFIKQESAATTSNADRKAALLHQCVEFALANLDAFEEITDESVGDELRELRDAGHNKDRR